MKTPTTKNRPKFVTPTREYVRNRHLPNRFLPIPYQLDEVMMVDPDQTGIPPRFVRVIRRHPETGKYSVKCDIAWQNVEPIKPSGGEVVSA